MYFMDCYYGDAAYFYGYGYGYFAFPILLNINSYPSEDQNIYVFQWTVPFVPECPDPKLLEFELQLDTVNTFDSSGLIVVTNIGDPQLYYMQQGDVTMAYEIELPERLENEEKIWYWKVRIKPDGPWTTIQEMLRPMKFKNLFAEDRLTELPSSDVYNKEILKIDFIDRLKEENLVYWTNVFRILNVFGEDYDKRQLELVLQMNDNCLLQCRDSSLYNNFGSILNFEKPAGMQNAEYKAILMKAFEAAMIGSTYAAIKKIVKIFTAVDPDFFLIRDDPEFVIGDSSIIIDNITPPPAKMLDDTNPLYPYINNIYDSGYPMMIQNRAVIWSKHEYAFGVIIGIYNPYNLTLNTTVIEYFIRIFMPSHVRYYIEYII